MGTWQGAFCLGAACDILFATWLVAWDVLGSPPVLLTCGWRARAEERGFQVGGAKEREGPNALVLDFPRGGCQNPLISVIWFVCFSCHFRSISGVSTKPNFGCHPDWSSRSGIMTSFLWMTTWVGLPFGYFSLRICAWNLWNELKLGIKYLNLQFCREVEVGLTCALNVLWALWPPHLLSQVLWAGGTVNATPFCGLKGPVEALVPVSVLLLRLKSCFHKRMPHPCLLYFQTIHFLSLLSTSSRLLSNFAEVCNAQPLFFPPGSASSGAKGTW